MFVPTVVPIDGSMHDMFGRVRIRLMMLVCLALSDRWPTGTEWRRQRDQPKSRMDANEPEDSPQFLSVHLTCIFTDRACLDELGIGCTST